LDTGKSPLYTRGVHEKHGTVREWHENDINA
jgi:hypothetical protein